MQKERYEEAIEQYRNALSVSHSLDYRLALALALVKAGHLDEARIYLGEVLRERPSSGAANLGMAEIEAQEGNIDQAILSYQRAIFGAWPEHSATQPVARRASSWWKRWPRRAGGRRPAPNCSRRLPPDRSPDPPIRLRKNWWAGCSSITAWRRTQWRCSATWRGTTSGTPAPGTAWAMRNSPRAITRKHAMPIAPAWQSIPPTSEGSRGWTSANKILALDPTLPGLDRAQRLERSKEIVSEAAAALARCGGNPGTLPRRATADENLTRAADLWATRPASCKPVESEEALAAVMAKIGRR